VTRILGHTSTGAEVAIDVTRLVESRMLVTATSGAGKSWALRRILEQTHGQVQHLVIDPEDEFHTLREKYDDVLAGRHGGDCPADLRSAELLARKLLELGVSAIVGIYELQHRDRIRFVRLFLESLVNAPRDLWRPCLIVVDEAHVFCPQAGEAESAGAVIDLLSRGRKRGFCGILATQRLSKLHKDAAAEAGNVLVGRSTLDVDVKRAADSLGFAEKDKGRVRNLENGQFFAYGPAIAREVTLVKVGPVGTTHPRPGQRGQAPPPAPARIRSVLAELQDLPAEAEKKAATESELRKRVAELERELRTKPVSVVDPEVINCARKEAAAAVHNTYRPLIDDLFQDLERMKSTLDIVRSAVIFTEAITEPSPKIAAAAPAPAPVVRQDRTTQPIPQVTRHASSFSTTKEAPKPDTLKGPERRILDAIAWLQSLGQDAPRQVAVAFLAGYTIGGGAFNNPRGALRSAGLVEYVGSDRIRLTAEGSKLANFPTAALSAEELQARILERLEGPQQRILKVLIDAYPKALTNEECARRAGYTPNAGAYNNPRGALRSLGLIEYPGAGQVVALPVLFLED